VFAPRTFESLQHWAALSRLKARRLPAWLRRTKAIGGLAANGKLKDRCSLATDKQRHQYFPPIWKFKCVVVPFGEMRVDDAKSRHAKARALGPYPSVIEPDVFLKSQFGAREEADGHPPIVLSGKTSRRRTPETRRDEFFADLGGTRLNGMQAIVTH
jgi:hypothetical protein